MNSLVKIVLTLAIAYTPAFSNAAETAKYAKLVEKLVKQMEQQISDKKKSLAEAKDKRISLESKTESPIEIKLNREIKSVEEELKALKYITKKQRAQASNLDKPLDDRDLMYMLGHMQREAERSFLQNRDIDKEYKNTDPIIFKTAEMREADAKHTASMTKSNFDFIYKDLSYYSLTLRAQKLLNTDTEVITAPYASVNNE